MRISLKNRIIFNLTVVIAVFGLLAGVSGSIFINQTTLVEAQQRVGIDIRSAWSVINSRFNELSILVGVLSSGRRVASVFGGGDQLSSRSQLEAVRRQYNLDFLVLTDHQGQVMLRTTPPYSEGDYLTNDPLISRVLKGQKANGFQVFDRTRLEQEGGDLNERAFIAFEPTPMAKKRAKESESSGLAMVAAAPITDIQGRLTGVIYGGTLLNRNHQLVDQIRSIVFEDEVIDGHQVGTVTIFQWDVRIATNVILPNGNRALGTRVSAEVYDKVLENNRPWRSRAFVVNDWYISAYEPVHDVENQTVGILYVGVLEKKYDYIRNNLWKVFGLLSLVAIILVAILGFVFARRLSGSISRLAEASTHIAAGELNLKVPIPPADDEIRDLTKSFNTMAASLRDREAKLSAARAELEQTNEALRRVNNNYLEMLGFISHELKNTLGVIFTSAKALDRGLAGSLSPGQASLIGGIARNIDTAVSMTRKYLDLTRIENGELRVQIQDLDLSEDVIGPVLDELAPAFSDREARLQNQLPPSLAIQGDPILLRVVFKNLLDNALKYGPRQGEIRLGYDRLEESHRFQVHNEGPGLSTEQIGKLFGKFTRFRPPEESGEKGTGLGLFITREIVVKHGGSITAESEPGQGVTFFIILPAKIGA